MFMRNIYRKSIKKLEMLRFGRCSIFNQIRNNSKRFSHSSPQYSGIQAVDKETKYDCIIVGGGHNGLVCSAYLARAGKKVLVLEKRHLIGGCAVTEELNEGFKYSRASYLFSLFRPKIIKDLELKRHGLELLPRNPSSFTPMLNGKSLCLGSNKDENYKEISQFSERDAKEYENYENWLHRLVQVIHPYLDSAPFDPSFTSTKWWEQIPPLLQSSVELVKLGREIPSFYELLTAPSSKILNKWFDSEPLKATLATDAVIGAMISPHDPGSGYVLFHHIMGNADENLPGSWLYVKGGMGELSNSIARSSIEFGTQIRCLTNVSNILIENGKSCGVILEDGSIISSDKVICNTPIHTTFNYLIDDNNKNLLPDYFQRHVKNLHYQSPVCKINLSLDHLPCFTSRPSEFNVPAPHHQATIHFNCESMENIHSAYMDTYANNIPSKNPIIEMTIPSVLDSTLAPPGKHVASLFCQYVPYAPNGQPWTENTKRDFARSVFKVIESYAPGFIDSILHVDILTPPDLESVFGLTGGHICHHSMGLDQVRLFYFFFFIFICF